MTETLTPRTYASLCVYGDDLDPPQLSKLLDVEPTSSGRKGDQIRRGRTAPRGFWILSTRDICDSGDTSTHIAALARSAGVRGEVLRRLRHDHLVRVFVYWDLQDGNGGPVLDPASLAWLADIGAELHVDLYESAPA